MLIQIELIDTDAHFILNYKLQWTTMFSVTPKKELSATNIYHKISMYLSGHNQHLIIRSKCN